jgi:hypothetical protein
MPALKEQIVAAQAAARQYVEDQVDIIKRSPEGATQPRDWLLLNQYAMARAGRCIVNVPSQ